MSTIKAVESMPEIDEQIQQQLDAACASHKERPFTDIVIIAITRTGDRYHDHLWYAPAKRTSEIIGLMEHVKHDMLSQNWSPK